MYNVLLFRELLLRGVDAHFVYLYEVNQCPVRRRMTEVRSGDIVCFPITKDNVTTYTNGQLYLS